MTASASGQALERAALLNLGLTADRYDGFGDVPGFQPLTVPQACEALLAAREALTVREAPEHPVPRLVILDSFVRLAAKNPGPLLDQPAGSPFDRLIDVLATEAEEKRGRGAVSAEVRKALGKLRGMDAETAWDTFAADTWQVLGLSVAEVNKPICTDQTLIVNGTPSTTIVTEFDSSLTVDKLGMYADPHNWPNCSIFFAAMIEKSMNFSLGNPTKKWVGTFQEVIDLLGVDPWITPLQFAYQDDTPGSIRSDYELIEPTPIILKDDGFIEITQNKPPVKSALTKTPLISHVKATKTIEFAPSYLQGWPGLACALFWGELCIDMAVECATGHGMFFSA